MTTDVEALAKIHAYLDATDAARGRVKVHDGVDVLAINADGSINVVGSISADGAIVDGVSSSIKATVLDYTNSNPLAVRLTDTNGDYVGAGAGTQYTEDAAAAANPVGNAQILVRADTPAGIVSTDGDNVAQRGTDYGAAYVTLLDTSGNPVSVGGGTQYTEDAAAAANPVGTALNLVRDDARAGSLTTTDGDNVAARGTNAGELYVKHVDAIPVTDNSGSLTVDNAVLSVVGGGTEATAQRVTIANDSTGVLSVDDNGGALTVDNGGTFAVQVTGDALTALQLIDNLVLAEDAAHQTGDVGVQMLAVRDDTLNARSGAENDYEPLHTNADGALWVLDVNSAAIKTAVEILDNAISGSEMQVDVVGALPAGTNNIGDVDILSIAAGDNNIGNVDIVTMPALSAGTNAIGKLLPPDIDVTAHTNYVKKYYTNAGAVTDGIIWSPASGKRWHVVSMYLQTSAAAVITLEDDKAGGDEAIWKGEFAANQGMTINFSEMYPLASGEDAADLIITTSAGNVYVTVTGYEV